MPVTPSALSSEHTAAVFELPDEISKDLGLTTTSPNRKMRSRLSPTEREGIALMELLLLVTPVVLCVERRPSHQFDGNHIHRAYPECAREIGFSGKFHEVEGATCPAVTCYEELYGHRPHTWGWRVHPVPPDLRNTTISTCEQFALENGLLLTPGQIIDVGKTLFYGIHQLTH